MIPTFLIKLVGLLKTEFDTFVQNGQIKAVENSKF